MLPPCTDSQLRAELGLIITAGWQLPLKPELELKVKFLLNMATGPTYDTYRDRAQRLLHMLDDALLHADQDLDEDLRPVTAEQRYGLRILYGTHPDYRDVRARERRASASSYIAEPRQKGKEALRPDTVYRQREEPLRQVTVELLRSMYGQRVWRERWIKTETMRVAQHIGIDEDGCLFETVSTQTTRSLQDGVTRVIRNIQRPPGCDNIRVEPMHDLKLWSLRETGPRQVTAIFELPEPKQLGERFRWSYRANFDYTLDADRPFDGCNLITEHNDDFWLILKATFRPWRCPDLIWWHKSSLLNYPVLSEDTQIVKPDEHGVVWNPRTRGTLRRYGYGIAWKWSQDQREGRQPTLF